MALSLGSIVLTATRCRRGDAWGGIVKRFTFKNCWHRVWWKSARSGSTASWLCRRSSPALSLFRDIPSFP